MADVKNYRLVDKYLPEHIVLPKIDYDDSWNEDIVETAGFIPLEVRFKQMEQAGFQAQFFEQEFSSKDVRDMYLNHPEFDITGEDDIEDALEKIELRKAYIESIKQRIRDSKSDIEGKNGQGGTERPTEENKTAAENAAE